MNAMRDKGALLKRKKNLIFGFFLLVFLLAVFSKLSRSEGPAPQDLVRTPVTVYAATGPVSFSAQLARSFEEKRIGLMYRKIPLSEKEGMLFIVSPAQPQAFWMKNTYIPLDILFIGEDSAITTLHENAIPHDETPLYSKGKAKAVLEMCGGCAQKLGIGIGDKVSAPAL